MTYLLDTHLLLWSTADPDKLSHTAVAMFDDPRNRFLFSAASLWELSIKARKRPDIFPFDVALLKEGSVESGFEELPVRSAHAIATLTLPAHHRDPFDRLLIAQALAEDVVLATVDADIRRYSAPIYDVS